MQARNKSYAERLGHLFSRVPAGAPTPPAQQVALCQRPCISISPGPRLGLRQGQAPAVGAGGWRDARCLRIPPRGPGSRPWEPVRWLPPAVLEERAGSAVNARRLRFSPGLEPPRASATKQREIEVILPSSIDRGRLGLARIHLYQERELICTLNG